MSKRELLSGVILQKRYEVGEQLGSGGFGATYLARDLARFNAPCVVKELLSARRDNATARRLFEREARVLFELSHPQIPELYAYFEEEERFYLVQQYIEGVTLADRLRRDTRLGEDEAFAVIDSLLGVLEYLHGRTPPVIHRDIKPANIILGATGTPYLIDFGAVREAIGAEDQQTAIGTPGYTPREQAVGRPRPSSDLYALGATALEMISGQHPLDWHDRSTGQLDWRGRVRCSPRMWKLLDGMLADVQQRFTSAREARKAMEDRAEQAPVVPAPDYVAPASAAPPSPATPAPALTPPVAARAESATQGPGWRALALPLVLVVLVAVAIWQWSDRPVTPAVSGSVPDTARQAATPIPAPVEPADSRVADVGSAELIVKSAPAAPTLVTPSRDSFAEIAPGRRPAIDTVNRRRDTSVTRGGIPDSMVRECARLLERVSLGETLSEREAARFRRYCQGS